METITIKVAPCSGNEKGLLVINKADYDPKVHTLAGEPDGESSGKQDDKPLAKSHKK